MNDVNVTGTDYSAIPDIAEFTEDGILRVPEGTEYILEESCHGREDLVELYLPESMKVVGPIAFAECPNLRKVILNEGLEEIGDGAFLGTPMLTEIYFPESLKRIGPMAFWAGGISSAKIPGNVEFIGESCFWDCSNLSEVEILNPGCVIEQDAFGDCPSLVEGYAAPGFPQDDYGPSNLLFSILWATSFERHTDNPDICERAEQFISERQNLVLEHILKADNTAAMRGIIEYKLFDADTIEEGLKASIASGQTELSSLFLAAKSRLRNDSDVSGTSAGATDEFEL